MNRPQRHTITFLRTCVITTMACGILTLASCIARSPAAKLFALPQSASTQTADASSVTFTLPQYLQRAEMRAFDAATGEVRAIPGGMWAEQPQTLFAEALAKELPGQKLAVKCTTFANDFSGAFQASGIITHNGATTPFSFTLPARGGVTTPASVAMQCSEAIHRLAEIVADEH